MTGCVLTSVRVNTSRVADPNNFVRKTRVLPVVTDGGVRLDFLFAAFPFEQRMIYRAPLRDVGSVTVRVATLEDLILLKLPSPRPRDQEDVRVILNTYQNSLEWDYLLCVGDLPAETLDQPAIAAALREHRPPPS